ncbi:transferase [Streptomyces viridochromogenes DSM 40736]|uniref:Transferase n=1 Tax=Streptomyces viridochromogenes (strain DSM 40736 / JCM 4977 / BCRC 1201 / Tue 494) TaxID=591159 RepID=D9XFG5_STRVT|nr:transferase [Streptomyces viridochromogenes DSM 40736]
MQPKTSSLADRPEMLERIVGMADSWPEFVVQDLVGAAHFPRIATELPEYVLFAEDERGEVVANAYSVPFALDAEGRGRLPANGWDAVLVWAFSDLRRGVRPDTVSAISVSVAPHAQGRGLSGLMLSAMRDNARARGFREVVAPVRPNAKHLEPHTPIEEYVRRVRPDGLPQDPCCASTPGPEPPSTPWHRRP